LALVIGLGALQAAAGVQPPASDLVSLRSYSGQFMAYAARSARLAPAISSLSTNQDFIRLEPTLATVSCERIKQILLRELNVTTPWRGAIYLVLYPAAGAGDPITITSERFRNGWRYRVDLPSVVKRPRYVRAIVQVLLLELADRSGPIRGAEIPVWLVEGFSQLLLASSEVEIMLPPPRAAATGFNFSSTFQATRKPTLLQQANQKLGGRPPLTFEALSWPTEQDLADDVGSEAYRGSAQLFVGELLRLPDGRACLQTMLARLSQHYNWQFAFLEAFHAHFARPLDVEKWWALSITQSGGRPAGQTWPLAESWEKLDQAVHPAVQVRTGTNELPLHTEVSLQTIIREWDPARQDQALGDALRELGLLRLRSAQEYLGLVQDYYQVINTYLLQRGRGAPNFHFTKRAGRQRAAEVAIQQLDALDATRMALRPGTAPAPAGPVPALPLAAH
jgi:hypothetical protein